MGNDINRTAVFRFISALSDEYAYKSEIHDLAASALKAGIEPELDKIYFLTPMLKYYKFNSGKESVYVRIFPPQRVLTEEEFQAEYVEIFDINKDVARTVVP